MSGNVKGRGNAGGMRQVGAALAGVLDPVAAKRGFGTARLMAGWNDIVGPDHAAWTRPEKLAFTRGAAAGGVLTVGVSGPRVVLLQHEIPQFIQRINSFLGFAAVAEIRLVQRAFSAGPGRAANSIATLTPAAKAGLDSAVAGVEAEGLRESLRALGAAVLARRLAKE